MSDALLSERLKANAALLDMMVRGETRLSRALLRALVADLVAQAGEARRLETERAA